MEQNGTPHPATEQHEEVITEDVLIQRAKLSNSEKSRSSKSSSSSECSVRQQLPLNEDILITNAVLVKCESAKTTSNTSTETNTSEGSVEDDVFDQKDGKTNPKIDATDADIENLGNLKDTNIHKNENTNTADNEVGKVADNTNITSDVRNNNIPVPDICITDVDEPTAELRDELKDKLPNTHPTVVPRLNFEGMDDYPSGCATPVNSEDETSYNQQNEPAVETDTATKQTETDSDEGNQGEEQNNPGDENSGGDNQGDENSGGDNQGDENSGEGNPGDENSGEGNPGDEHSGGDNQGDENSGGDNQGDENSGEGNPGDENSGEGNPGDEHSGGDNQGDEHSGGDNQGDENSGGDNQGDENSGEGNPGDETSGEGNPGDENSGGNNQGDENSGGDNQGVDQNNKNTVPVEVVAEDKSRNTIEDEPLDYDFNELIIDIANAISGHEFDAIKTALKGLDCLSETDLIQLTSPLTYLNHLRRYSLISRDNLAHLQTIASLLNKPEVHQKARQYTEHKFDVVFFFPTKENIPPSYETVKCHVKERDFTRLKRGELESIRTGIANQLFIPSKFVYIVGIEPGFSVIVSLMFHKRYISVLEDILEGSMSQVYKLGVDAVQIRGKSFTIGDSGITTEEDSDYSSTAFLSVFHQLKENNKQLAEKDEEIFQLSQETELMQLELDTMSAELELLTERAIRESVISRKQPKKDKTFKRHGRSHSEPGRELTSQLKDSSPYFWDVWVKPTFTSGYDVDRSLRDLAETIGNGNSGAAPVDLDVSTAEHKDKDTLMHEIELLLKELGAKEI